MTQSTTQPGIQPIEAEIIEPDSSLESNSSSNETSKPSNFPCSKLEASKHLPISDVTVGNWLKSLIDAGVRGAGNKVSATDFHHLSEMSRYKAEGQPPSDYVSLIEKSVSEDLMQPMQNAGTVALSTQKYETHANLALSRQANGQAKALSLIESLKHSQNLTRTRRTTGRETAKANAVNDAVQDAEIYINTYSQTQNQILDAFHGVEGES